MQGGRELARVSKLERELFLSDMAFARDDQAARLEGYEPLDLHKSGDVCFALRQHHIDPEEDACSPSEVVEEVLRSSRLQRAVLEVCSYMYCFILLHLLYYISQS